MIITMKHLLTLTFLLSFCTVALFANAETFLNKKEYAYVQAKGTLKVYVEPDVYFYTYTYDNYLNGYAIHYLRLLAKKLDMELEFMDGFSRQEAKEKLSSGELDVALFPVFEGTSDNAFQLSLFPVGVVQPALLVPKIYQRSPTIESFENVRMVVIKGDAFGAIIKEKNPDAQIEVVETLEQAFTKVAQQEVDVAIGIHELFLAQLESKMIHTLQSIPLRNHADFPMLKLSLAMASDNVTLLSIINKAMAVIEYKELLFARNRFFPTNTFRQTNILASLNEEEKFFLMGKQVLNVCIIPKSMPYGDIINKSYQGLGAQMIPLLEKSLDIPMQLIPTRTPQESRQKLLEKKCDFINLDTPHKDVDDKITFTSSLLNVPLVVITRDDISYVAHFSEVVDKSFVILQEHPMLPSLKKMFPSLNLLTVDSEIEGLKRIEEGKHYGFITSNFSVSHLFRSHIADTLKVSAHIPLEMPFSFSSLAENSVLQTILEKMAHSMRENEMPKLVKQWIPERYPRGFDHHVVLQLIFSFILFCALAFYLYYEVVLKNIRLEETRKSLDTLNHELESRIKHEVELSREKDMVMYRQSRFASMGEMIGNIAHQWRQPLMELSALLMDLQARIHFSDKVSSSDVIETISSSNRVIQFMSRTIDDFRHFFSPHKTVSVFCINEVIDEAVNIMSASLVHANIRVDVVTNANSSFAYGLKNEYAQVIINLLSNAKDILISRKVKEGKITIMIDEINGYSKVSVMDNGGGIENEDFSQIFEPFFTKNKTEGTGIGLFMSRMIIEKNMKGIITAGNVDDGVAFCITVPSPKERI